MALRIENAALQKSYSFSIRIVRLARYLRTKKSEFVLSKQILRSGTSIAANIFEAIYAQSSADFINKYSISLKEASETSYWLNLLYDTEYLSQREFESIYTDCEEIVRILSSIVKTSKEHNNRNTA